MVANWFYMPSLFVIQNIFSPIRIIEQTRFLEKGLRRASKQGLVKEKESIHPKLGSKNDLFSRKLRLGTEKEDH